MIDRHVGRGPALVSASILLVLGSGYQNLFSAFQMGFVGAAALALWGLLQIRDRPIIAATLLSLGVLAQGTALFLIPSAAYYGRSRRALLACAAPIATYAAWYLLIGRTTMAVRGHPPNLANGIGYFVEGIAASTSALLGLGSVGLLVLVLAIPALYRPSGHDAARWTAAAVGVIALATEYGLLAMSRQGFDPPNDSHYVYFGAAFLLPVLASAWPGVPRWGRPAVILVVSVAALSNLLTLAYWSGAWAAEVASNSPVH